MVSAQGAWARKFQVGRPTLESLNISLVSASTKLNDLALLVGHVGIRNAIVQVCETLETNRVELIGNFDVSHHPILGANSAGHLPSIQECETVSQIGQEVFAILSASINLVRLNLSDAAYRPYKQIIGRVMGELSIEVLWPVWNTYPVLKPVELR